MSAVTVSNEREIQPMMLSLEQLSKLKQQHEEELQELQKQLEALHGAKYRFINARTTIDDISQSRTGEEILIPLSSSLYVPGKIRSPGKVIVELGTGYFCEKNIPEAKDLIDRKVNFALNI
jgi:prefoldin alpha subunit